jgi:hypothetical protein
LKNRLLADIIEKKYSIFFPGNTALDYPGFEEIKCYIENFNTQKEFIIQTVKKNGAFQADLKQIVKKIALPGNNTLEIGLHLTNKKAPKLIEIVGHILHLGEKEKKALRIIKLN